MNFPLVNSKLYRSMKLSPLNLRSIIGEFQENDLILPGKKITESIQYIKLMNCKLSAFNIPLNIVVKLEFVRKLFVKMDCFIIIIY